MSTGKSTVVYIDDLSEMRVEWEDDDEISVEYGDDHITVRWDDGETFECRRRKS